MTLRMATALAALLLLFPVWGWVAPLDRPKDGDFGESWLRAEFWSSSCPASPPEGPWSPWVRTPSRMPSRTARGRRESWPARCLISPAPVPSSR